MLEIHQLPELNSMKSWVVFKRLSQEYIDTYDSSKLAFAVAEAITEECIIISVPMSYRETSSAFALVDGVLNVADKSWNAFLVNQI